MQGRKMTQCEMILVYMEEHGSISQMEAYSAIGCTRLPARISDLRKSGYPIIGKRTRHKSADGKVSNFMRYSMGSGSSG